MSSYEYFRKIETNGNLLIFCQLHRILPRVPVQKWRHRGLRDGQNLLSKVNFPANSAIQTTCQLFPIKI